MKKALSILLAMALILSTAAVVSAEAPVKLVFWDMIWGAAGTYDKAAQELVNQFNQEQSGIQVEYQSVPWDNYYQVFLTAISSGEGPDVATAGSQTPMQFAAMGEITSLNPLVEKWKVEGDPILDDFMFGFLETNHLGDDYIALPWHADTRAFIYRKDMFEEAGVTELPTTWEGLHDALAKVKAKFPDVIPLVTAGDLGGSQNLMVYLSLSNDIGQVTEDLSKGTLSDPKMTECLQFVAQLMDEGLLPEALVSYKSADADRIFMSGQAAVMYSGPNKVYWNEPTIADKLAILPPPKGPSATEPHTVYFANSIAAYKTEHPDEARTFVEWWLKNDLKLFIDGAVGKAPIMKSQAADPFFGKHPIDKALTEVIAPTFRHATWPVANFFPAWGQIYGERYLGAMMQEVLTGRRDFAEIQAEQDANVNAALELQK